MNPKRAELGRKPINQRSHQPDYALSLAVRHPTKYEALVVLHEGEHTAKEVADLIGLDVKHVDGHIKELFKAGNIELAGYRQEGRQAAIYRAIVPSEVSDEVARTMSPEERHDLSGAVAQDVLVETMSGYRNGKLDEDPVFLWWDAQPLDTLGKLKMHALFCSTQKQAAEIVGDTMNRMAESGESGQMTFFGLLNFERGRPGKPRGSYLLTGKPE